MAFYLTNNNSDDINDNDSVEVISGPSQPVANKGKIPFSCVPRVILGIMQDKLNTNLSKGNVDSSSVDTLRTIFKSVIKYRVYLLELAKKLDATMEIQGEGGEVIIQDLLAREIPTV
jgi:hypothetical protein